MSSNNPLSVYKGLPRGIYIMFISRIIDNMGSVVMPMITLILTQKIGLSKNSTGILATVFMVSQAPFLLLGGKLVDKMGSKKVIVIFNSLGALAYIPCGLMKPNIGMALLIALAANLFSVAAPAYNSIVTELVGEEKIKSAYSILFLGYNLGLAIGPAIGGMLFNRYLQTLFFIDAITCIISVILVYFYVPNNSLKKRIDSAFELNESAVKLIFKSPILITFSVLLLGYNFCYSQWGFMLPLQSASLFLENGAKYYSILVSVNAVCVILFTPVLTHLTQKFRPLSIVTIGGLFYMFSFLIFAEAKDLFSFIVSVAIMTIGQILININVNIYIAQQVPQTYIGRANSVLSIVNGIGVAVGPVIMGYVLLNISYETAWVIIAGLMLFDSLGMFIISARRYNFMKDNNQ